MSLCVNSFGNCAKCLSHQLTITNGLKSVQRHLVIVSYLAEVESVFKWGTYLDMSLCLCVSLSIVFFIVSLYVWRSLVCMYEDSPQFILVQAACVLHPWWQMEAKLAIVFTDFFLSF